MSSRPEWIESLRSQSDRDAAAIELSERFIAGDSRLRRSLTDGWPFASTWPYPNQARLGCVIGKGFRRKKELPHRSSLTFWKESSVRGSI